MGDRFISYVQCPKCGSEYERYDAPSSLMYSAHCEACGYDENLSYVEIDNALFLINGDVKKYIMKLEDENRDMVLKCYNGP